MEAWAEIDAMFKDGSPISCDPTRSKDMYQIALEELRRSERAAAAATPVTAAAAIAATAATAAVRVTTPVPQAANAVGRSSMISIWTKPMRATRPWLPVRSLGRLSLPCARASHHVRARRPIGGPRANGPGF